MITVKEHISVCLRDVRNGGVMRQCRFHNRRLHANLCAYYGTWYNRKDKAIRSGQQRDSDFQCPRGHQHHDEQMTVKFAQPVLNAIFGGLFARNSLRTWIAHHMPLFTAHITNASQLSTRSSTRRPAASHP